MADISLEAFATQMDSPSKNRVTRSTSARFAFGNDESKSSTPQFQRSAMRVRRRSNSDPITYHTDNKLSFVGISHRLKKLEEINKEEEDEKGKLNEQNEAKSPDQNESKANEADMKEGLIESTRINIPTYMAQQPKSFAGKPEEAQPELLKADVVYDETKPGMLHTKMRFSDLNAMKNVVCWVRIDQICFVAVFGG